MTDNIFVRSTVVKMASVARRSKDLFSFPPKYTVFSVYMAMFPIHKLVHSFSCKALTLQKEILLRLHGNKVCFAGREAPHLNHAATPRDTYGHMKNYCPVPSN